MPLLRCQQGSVSYKLLQHSYLLYVLAVLAGLLLPLGFAPFEWRFFSVISPTAFFILLTYIPQNRAFWTGYCYGLGFFGFGVSWIANSVYEFGGASIVIAFVLAMALVAVMACCFGLMAWLAVRFFRSSHHHILFLCLVLPSLWLLNEAFRSWIFTGFPWLLLGYSQIDTYLASYIPVFGVMASALPITLISSGLAVCILGVHWQRCIGVVLILCVSIIAIILQTFTWSHDTGESVAVAVVQASIPQKIKMNPDKVQVSLDTYTHLTKTIQAADLIIWPETAIPSFNISQQSFIEATKSILATKKASLISGIFYYDWLKKQSYNSLMMISDDPHYHGQFYFKQRLVPFGEYLPLRNMVSIFSSWVNMPIADLYPADEVQQPFVYKNANIGASICYESAYGAIFTQQLPDAHMFINVSNDAWFGRSLAPYQHLEMLRARAIETGRYMVRSTNTGISAIINERGELQESLDINQVGVIQSNIVLKQGKMPNQFIAHWVFIGILLILLWRLYTVSIVKHHNN